MEYSDGLKELIAQSGKIVITTHFKPDGDALGSALAMNRYLKKKGLDSIVILPSDFPYFLKWMPGQAEALIYPENLTECHRHIAEADLIIGLDFNDLSRINDLRGPIETSKASRLMIDHHLEPSGFDQYRFWNSQAAATCQLVYRFITDVMHDRDLIDTDIATCLYTGIMTDTGSFRFQNTTREVHMTIADLIEHGAENWRIHEHIYNSNTESRLKFLGHCLAHNLVVIPEYKTAYFSITQDELQRFTVETGDTEGLVNYALSIQGIKLAALFIDRGELIKISFRSTGEFACNELSKKHFNGGGHRNAAGGSATEKLDKAVERFRTILPEYKTELIKP